MFDACPELFLFPPLLASVVGGVPLAGATLSSTLTLPLYDIAIPPATPLTLPLPLLRPTLLLLLRLPLTPVGLDPFSGANNLEIELDVSLQ